MGHKAWFTVDGCKKRVELGKIQCFSKGLTRYILERIPIPLGGAVCLEIPCAFQTKGREKDVHWVGVEALCF